MKKFHARAVGRLARCLAAGALLSPLAAPVHAADITLRVHHFLPEQAPAHQAFLLPWKQTVERESEGRIEVRIFPRMELGGRAPDLIDQVIDGTVDLVWTLPGYSPGRFPAISAFELPFMVTDAEATSQALQEYYDTNPAAQSEFSELQPLIFWTHDRGVLHTRQSRPVERLTDLDGLRIRAPSQRVAESLAAYGAEPFFMPLPQMPGALAAGDIDGAVIPWEVVPSLRIHELADTAIEFPGERGIYTSVFLFAMNKDRYLSLPDDLRRVIDGNSGMAWSRAMGKTWSELERPNRDLAASSGVHITAMPLDEVARMRAASYHVHALWAEEMEQQGLGGGALLYSAYSLLNKYSRR